MEEEEEVVAGDDSVAGLEDSDGVVAVASTGWEDMIDVCGEKFYCVVDDCGAE